MIIRSGLVGLTFFVNLLSARMLLPSIPDLVKYPEYNGESEDLDSDEADPEVRPGLFQGDMAVDREMFNYLRVGLRPDRFLQRLWPNLTVPYTISPLYEPEDQITILKAIRKISFMTCLRFVPWNYEEEDFLLVWPVKYPQGCWSYIGKVGGAQIISLQPPDERSINCLGNEGRALHEIMHALGIYHEQARSDRDSFVKVHWDNIIPAYKSNFQKTSLENTTYSFEYDYNSIMHYGKYYFSKEKGKPTLTSRMPGMKFGQRENLTKYDCLKINALYGCLNSRKAIKKYYTLCRILGV